ncbi:aldehyde dehydrogenase family protein [Amycolatopsis sp. NPDC059090]|uniref:aldehyde dehydrogenase family protein n=1 Tax=unclassified Amycolatopsis TaxID=2618356 RepID=UPI00366CAFEC
MTGRPEEDPRIAKLASSVYIGGRWEASADETPMAVVDPSDGSTVAEVPAGDPSDVDRAVDAARAAFGSWSALPVRERAEMVARLGEGLRERGEELARTITREMGTPITESRQAQVPLGVRTFRRTAELAASFAFEERLDDCVVRHEPVGVVAALVPWNYPLYLTATKVAPALVAGCPVVLKPSEIAPLSAVHLADVADEAGLPPGVLNVLSGGAAVGAALAGHPGVDAVSFTGSAANGRSVAAAAGAALSRVTLELGGKSPSVVLPGGDLPAAVAATVRKGFQNAGQTCAALTRLLVPRARLAEAEEIAEAQASRYVAGTPLDPDTTLGPLGSAAQRDRVETFVRSGIRSGARLVTGGPGAPEGFGGGAYVRPTVFSDVDPGAEIATEEIFGPVLVILAYETEEQAVALANATASGLAAAVWAAEEEHAMRVGRAIRAGSVAINGAPTHPDAPFGGFKQSGFGRERGRYGIAEFLATQTTHRTRTEGTADAGAHRR